MPDFSYFPAYIAAFFSAWFSEMSTLVGVFSFLFALVFAAFKRPLAFGALITIAAGAIVIAGYDAWRTEYLKNVGDAYMVFKAKSAHEISGETIDFSVEIENDTAKPLTIEDIRLARIWITDTFPFPKLRDASICMNTIQWSAGLPHVLEERNKHNRRWESPGRPDLLYEYLDTAKIAVDGADTSTIFLSVNPQRAHIFSIQSNGMTVDRDKYNGTIICPIITYTTYKLRESLICAGASEGRDQGQVEGTIDENAHSLMGNSHQNRCRKIPSPV